MAKKSEGGKKDGKAGKGAKPEKKGKKKKAAPAPAETAQSDEARRAEKDCKAQNPPGRILHGKELVFPLTRDNLADMGMLSADLGGQIEEIQQEAKEAAAGFKVRIDEREEKRSELDAAIRAKAQKRVVTCTQVSNFQQNIVEFWFRGEKIEERAMTHDERQLEMDLREREAETMGKKQVADARAEQQAETTAKVTNIRERREKDAAAVATGVPATVTDEDLQRVIRDETRKNSKHSSVDGVYDN